MSGNLVLGTLGVLALTYVIGSIPWAYIIVKAVTGEDITKHGTGNVGAMNVRRSTGSWAWFTAAMLADGFKGIIPVAAIKAVSMGSVAGLLIPASKTVAPQISYLAMAAVAGVVMGHNYSLWMAVIHRRFGRTGKGLATGAGALLAYDWRYFAAVMLVGLIVIAATRYMMAGQVAGALTLPVTALLLRSTDWPFALVMGAVVYAAHHKRFVGLLTGHEPRFYIHDQMGPRG